MGGAPGGGETARDLVRLLASVLQLAQSFCCVQFAGLPHAKKEDAFFYVKVVATDFNQAALPPVLQSAAPWTSTWLSSVLTRRRCGGQCGKSACATMKNHIQHRNETSGQCRCTTCRGIETCVVLHARRCRSPTCPIGACRARRRLQDAQAAAAAPAPARLPPPAAAAERGTRAAERATTSGLLYAPGPQSHLFRR